MTGLSTSAITWEELQKVITTNSDGMGSDIDLTSWGGGTITLADITPDDLTSDMFALPSGKTETETATMKVENYTCFRVVMTVTTPCLVVREKTNSLVEQVLTLLSFLKSLKMTR